MVPDIKNWLHCMKNNLIIFSKNRACQLHLLLESINQNSFGLFDNITVIYKSDPYFLTGYSKVIYSFDEVNFISENDFRHDVLNLITDEYEFTTFLVDDVVFYESLPVNKNEILSTINENTCCFSLRLGLNCTYSHPANIRYNIKNYYLKGEHILVFKLSDQDIGDFKYPLSTDGHIYNTKLLRELLLQTLFTNPNTLEAGLQRFVRSVPNFIFCFRRSKIVSIPANIVNDTFKNRHGLEHPISEKHLNDRYINGEKIDINAMDFQNINGPHKEIKYEFKHE